MSYRRKINHYDELFEMQGGRCAICGDAQGTHGVDLEVDHDYETGFIRGLLCHGCNVQEGWSVTPEILEYRVNHPAVGRGWIYRGARKRGVGMSADDSYDALMAGLK